MTANQESGNEPSPLALVPFVSVAHMMELINGRGVERVLREIADYIEEDFKNWPQFHKQARVAAHSEDGVIELMPAADAEHYGFKYVNGHPKNMREGLQTVTAFGVLAKVASGYPILISEMTLLTALRTAAMSALAGRELAAPGATTMAMIGNGAQCEFQAIAFKALVGIGSVRLYDVDPAATAKVVRNLANRGLDVVSCASVEEAVEGAQIITTCTAAKRRAVAVADELIRPGVHLNAIGGDCPGKTELAVETLRRASIFVEYEEQTRVEGEIQQLEPSSAVTELWQVLRGEVSGRKDAQEITLFDSVGFAIEDFAALRYVHDRVTAGAAHEELDLLADPDDPRDLFGMILRAQT
ncbi:ornithine cyclodeaminase [Sulfuriroseicoccus oceanibius]|uniref:Ornithine cyclodeaminase n=1 Tax=Sulfuriroseicoccus oceanibius TaxID=2707525 RepID=A0A6B3L2M2_9BACT|nr:ornithine cyclodeaminase [Sulfuriroseicoccus oceanibius]QQL46094.1 ornithine cyclodeaminase [Sulfuriroseicoccus oceanibius]